MQMRESTGQIVAARNRPGAALVMAVVAMAVLGALVAGVFFAALREQRDGRDGLNRVTALAAAEYGLAPTLSPSVWRRSWNVTASRGPIAQMVYAPMAGSSDSVRVWKLTRNGFLLQSSGTSGVADARASRRIALLVALRIPSLAMRAAAIASAGITASDSSLISGRDTAPDGWNCPPPDDARPAAVVPDPLLVSDAGCTNAPCIDGLPPVASDSLAGTPGPYQRLGTLTRDSIAAAAEQLAPGAVYRQPAPAVDALGECDPAAPGNLGDPLLELGIHSPCADHLPVLHVPGNMRIEGGAAQGMLLVDGDLALASGTQFSGVALVGGVLEVTDGSSLAGAALASRITVRGGSRLRYSSCAVERALRGAAEPVIPRGMAWSEMY